MCCFVVCEIVTNFIFNVYGTRPRGELEHKFVGRGSKHVFDWVDVLEVLGT